MKNNPTKEYLVDLLPVKLLTIPPANKNLQTTIIQDQIPNKMEPIHRQITKLNNNFQRSGSIYNKDYKYKKLLVFYGLMNSTHSAILLTIRKTNPPSLTNLNKCTLLSKTNSVTNRKSFPDKD